MIIVGGSTRVPAVQQILERRWGRELGKSLNADEAAALGAIYRAATLGPGFKVLPFHVKDALIHPIEVSVRYRYHMMLSNFIHLGHRISGIFIQYC